MKILFVTTNKHKVEEAQAALRGFPVELEQMNRSYEENHDASIEEVARTAAKKLANEIGRPLLVEDTGIFFEAYDGFPGALPKYVFNSIGFKGIFKLLEGENRATHFKTVVAYCEPGQEPMLFDGVMRGTIIDHVVNPEKDVMPYDRIFIPDGHSVTVSEMTLEDKTAISQRAAAFRKFGEYIQGRSHSTG